MSILVEEYLVLVRLPNGTLTEITVQAMDMYAAAKMAESMTGGTNAVARRKN